MNINEAFPSKYLKASDLQGKQPTVTISQVVFEDINDSDRKPVIYFAGQERGIVLNKTNATNISDSYGPDTDDWSGKKVVLFTTWVDFNGKSVEAIRMRPAPSSAEGSVATEKVPPTFEEAPVNDGNGQPATMEDRQF